MKQDNKINNEPKSVDSLPISESEFNLNGAVVESLISNYGLSKEDIIEITTFKPSLTFFQKNKLEHSIGFTYDHIELLNSLINKKD